MSSSSSSSSSSASQKELDSPPPPDISAELALWKQLAFAFDMSPPTDENRSNEEPATPSSSQVSPRFQVPHAALPPLPPETYNHLIHALLSLQSSASHTYPQNYSPTHPNNILPWLSGITTPSTYLTNPPIPPPPRAVPENASTSQPVPIASPATASTVQDSEGADDAVSVTEDKRLRNTAASARFRLKKKLRTLNLERTVTDFTGRTEELEREATDLRRENAWLKEIILLKSRHLGALKVGSQPPVSGDRHDGGEQDDLTHTESELNATPKRREKGKNKER